MRRYSIFSVMLLSGCLSEQPRINVPVIVDVPATLRRPCPGPTFQNVTNQGSFGDAVFAQQRALECANNKIIAIDKILSCSENQSDCEVEEQ